MYKIGQFLRYDGTAGMAAKEGATCVVTGYKDYYVQVRWIRNGLDCEQADGGYMESYLKPIESKTIESSDIDI